MIAKIAAGISRLVERVRALAHSHYKNRHNKEPQCAGDVAVSDACAVVRHIATIFG